MTDFGELSWLSEGTAARYRPGGRLGRYELLVPIGSGGMALVWIARLRGEAGFSKLVAIKTMLPHLVEVEEARRMVFDEARVAARIHHPNVVAIQELGDEQGIPYVVMEWVNGISLDRLLHTSPPPEEAIAARIVADACAGLHAAHELLDDAGKPLHVVHRDISPYNVLISTDGAVKVADFGIVKARGQLHRTTSIGDVRGRISYMAPEQVMAEQVDRRADVFAMGATLHEVLTGDPAFAGENDAQIIFKIAQTTYEPPARSGESSRELFAIAARALARRRDDRFNTAEEMRLALEVWLAKNAPPVVTPSIIAHTVRERLGAELEHRQTLLRKALNAPTADSSTRPTITLQGVGNPAAGESPVPEGGANPESSRSANGPGSKRDPHGAYPSAPMAESALSMAYPQSPSPQGAALDPGARAPRRLGLVLGVSAAALLVGVGAWARHLGTVVVPTSGASLPDKAMTPVPTSHEDVLPFADAGLRAPTAPVGSVATPPATFPSNPSPSTAPASVPSAPLPRGKRGVSSTPPPSASARSGLAPSSPEDEAIPTNPY